MRVFCVAIGLQVQDNGYGKKCQIRFFTVAFDKLNLAMYN